MRTLVLILSLMFMRSLAQPWAHQRGKDDSLGNTGTAKGQGFFVGYGRWSRRPYNDWPSFHHNEGRKAAMTSRPRVKRDLAALAAKIATNAAFGSAFAAGVGVKAYVIQVWSLMQFIH